MEAESLTDTRRRLALECSASPDDVRLFMALSEVLTKLGAYEDLLEVLDEGVGRWPQNNRIHMLRALINYYLGNLQDARSGYLHVLERKPGHIGASCDLVKLGYGADIDGLNGIDALLSQDSLTDNQHIRLFYARAKLLETEKRYEEAFEVYREANSRQAASANTSIDAMLRGAQSVINDVTPAIIERFSGEGNASAQPVFIVGMPRSGTSLTEQMLASHRGVYGGGEQPAWGNTLSELVSAARPENCTMVEAIDRLHPDVWSRAGDSYLHEFDELNSDAMRITNKLPANFGLLPYIRLIFPRAKIIHLRREPLATIASCIRQHFGQPALAFSVENWARFYGIYLGLMDQWQPILGEQVLNVDYEELVQDFPGQARRIVAFTGLDWDDACLHPEMNRRAVNTASAQQVRSPVHTGAISAWRRYETQLETLRPLIEDTRGKLNCPHYYE